MEDNAMSLIALIVFLDIIYQVYLEFKEEHEIGDTKWDVLLNMWNRQVRNGCACSLKCSDYSEKCKCLCEEGYLERGSKDSGFMFVSLEGIKKLNDLVNKGIIKRRNFEFDPFNYVYAYQTLIFSLPKKENSEVQLVC